MENPTDSYDMTLIGYARVSTEEQNLDMQTAALVRAGVHPDNIHCEKVSGVATKRPGRDAALKSCRPGDTLVVWKLDRVGRSLLDLLSFMQRVEAAGIGFRSLQDSIDTTTPAGRVMLAMLGAFAQFERDLISQRTRAGVEQAMARGVKFGQPKKLTDDKKVVLEQMLRDGLTVQQCASQLKMSEATIRKQYPRAVLDRIRAGK
jgi:DNA invertase Pin-like site-specific DNA recombinase